MNQKIQTRIEQIRRGEVPEGYKKTKVGIVPEEWERLSIENIYKERKEHGKEGFPVLSVSIHTGVSDGELDDDELGKSIKRIEDKTQYLMARPGDLVFNMMRAWQGAIGVVKTTGLVSPAYIVAEPDQERVFPPFMDDYMKFPQMVNMLHRQSYGVTDFRLRLYWDSFAKIETVVPPLAEQEKIAEILAAQDKVIALKEKLLEEKKKQKKYLMQQLLTGKKRLSGFTDEWEKVQLKYLLKERKTYSQKDQEYPHVTLSNEGIYGKTERYDRDHLVKSEDKEYKITLLGDICYNPANLKFGAICVNDFGNAIFSPIYVTFEVTKRARLFFLSNYMMRWDFINAVRKYEEGTVYERMAVKPEDLLRFEIMLPPLKEQDAIGEVLSNADKEISAIQKSIDQEKQKKKALMQLLLTGIVRVTV